MPARSFPLIAGKTITLGRLKTCDIQVDELSVSRRHCTVYTRDTGCVVVDLQAANGTFVNERRVETSHLEPGDRLRVGSIILELAVAASARSRPSGGGRRACRRGRRAASRRTRRSS